MNLHPFWYALTVKPRYEKLVAEHLRVRGLEDFLPYDASAVPGRTGFKRSIYRSSLDTSSVILDIANVCGC